MSDIDSSPERPRDRGDERYGTVTVGDPGRLTIPKSLREDLNLTTGAEFTVVREGASIRLDQRPPAIETLTRESAWDDDAFPKAGRSTFGDLEDTLAGTSRREHDSDSYPVE